MRRLLVPEWGRWAWVAFPIAGWLLPVWYVAVTIFVVGDWNGAIALVLGPVAILIEGISVVLLRVIMKKRGRRQVPGGAVWLMFLHAWAWIIGPFLVRRETDHGDPNPLLVNVFPGMFDVSTVIDFSGLVHSGILVTGVGAVIVCLTRPVREITVFQSVLAWCTAIPFVFVGSFIGIALHSQQGVLDASGESLAEATDRSVAEQHALAEQRVDAASDSLAPAWSLISSEPCVPIPEMRSQAPPWYRVVFNCRYEAPDSGASTVQPTLGDQVLAELRQGGWTYEVDAGYPNWDTAVVAEHPAGYTAHILVGADGSAVFETWGSPSYWGQAPERG